MVERITILGGRGRDGSPEAVERVDLAVGEVATIVGPTGSGKTTLINDIELFADGDTPSGRRVLFDGAPAPASRRDDPARNPIALITQHTTFLSDMPVGAFLRTHARIRAAAGDAEEVVASALSFANELTGEPIAPDVRMTELSGGQTRALLIADAAVICATPVVLLDEVENAGIDRGRAIELLRRRRKIFLFVTHDPRIALLSDRRIAMRAGRMAAVLETSDAERALAKRVGVVDDALARLRDELRAGRRPSGRELDGLGGAA